MNDTATVSVLVVEDDGIIALDLQDTLESMGYTVLGPTDNGNDAIALSASTPPSIILMDIRIRGEIDGIETAARIWDSQHIPIVFLTAFADEETLSRARFVKPFGYILKPFKEQELHATLQMALERFKASKENTSSEESSAINRKKKSVIAETATLGSKDLTPFDILKRTELLRKLPEELLHQLADGSTINEYKHNRFIQYEGDAEAKGFVVLSGRAALLKTSPSGKQLTVALLPPGDVFSVLLALDETSSSYTAVTHGETTVLTIPKTLLQLALDKEPSVYKAIHEEMTSRMKKAHEFSLRLAHDNVDIRIAATILELLADFGRYQQEDDSYRIQVTRQQIANIAGTTPETTIRVTRSFEDAGYLDLSEPGYIRVLTLESLESLISD